MCPCWLVNSPRLFMGSYPETLLVDVDPQQSFAPETRPGSRFTNATDGAIRRSPVNGNTITQQFLGGFAKQTPGPSNPCVKGYAPPDTLRLAALLALKLPEPPPNLNERGSTYRGRRTLRYRSIVCALAREFTILSYPEIAKVAGLRSHSAALESARRAMQADPASPMGIAMSEARTYMERWGYSPMSSRHGHG